MDVKEIKAEGLLRQYTISVAAAELQEKKSERLTEVGKTVKIQGFRTGKAPARLLEERYGNAVMQEILEKTVNEQVTKIFQEKEIKPADQPKIEVKTYDEKKGLEFDMTVEVLPTIEHIDYSKISINKKVAEVSEDEVKKSLENIAENHSSSEPIKTKRKAKKGDIAMIDFIGRIDGEAFAGGSGNDYALELGAGMFIEGFEAQVEGQNPGETFDVNVTFPENYGASELAGKDAVFEVTLKEIHAKTAAKLDDDLAKKLGLEDFTSLEKNVKEQHQKQYDGLSKMHMKRELLDALDEKYSFELPQILVDRELEAIVGQWQQQKAQNPEELGDEANMSEEEIRAEYLPIAERRVRLGLVLTDLGQKEKVTITEDDRRQALFNEIRRFPGQEQQVFEFFQKNPQALSALEAPILEERVIDIILAKAKLTEIKATVEELMADPDEEKPAPKKKASAKKEPAAKKEAPKKKPAAKKADEDAKATAEKKPAAKKKTTAAKPKAKKKETSAE